ncbi:Domain of uncharacterised function (DUF1983) [Phocoenobacter uteri]|uniref:Domain of uncharacterized function (DUF1983) n=1 Tax=Phocoenobacter uteri TaxID=146806 RepID=A0A379C9F6_9PAST|nr:phage tail protein [Phocoenobacter uteri]MDG6882781.1 hypothetical protein [Phocoenobacter uteri]SUB58950.1 Domain of uncharacterised function (DUF1983) [Phocoenobacter uteri]
MGGQSGGGGHTPYEAPDSLKSSQRLRAIGLISLGPIKGPVNKWKSTYFDNTPIQKEEGVDDNDEASFNFKNTEIQYNLGTQDQLPLEGFECSEREVSVGVEVKKDHPITRTVIDKDITRVRLTMGVNALFEQNDEGDTNGTDVTFQVLINDTDYSTFTISGKSSSHFARSYILTNLPERPFSITVKRITEDSNSQRLQNTTFWSSYTEIIDTKLSYPNMAIVGIKTDSRYNPHFPNVNFLLQGRLVKIPANYNPYTRTYEGGLWKGDFKLDWTNNPAWIFYDLITNKLVGLGERLGEYGVDKFQLYQIAQYCDQLVDDGYGGKEPRMTANLWLTSQRDAYSVLADMASVFRAIVAWNGTQLMATQDRATDPVCAYTQANVVNGKFSRRYVPLKAIYTAVEVEYVDARNRYQKTIEYIADDLMIARYGYNVKKIVAFACTSRGQARRYGKWILETSRLEQCTITFSVGREGLRHLPGDIIEVADNSYANLNLGGRVVAIKDRTVTLDRAVELVGESYISYVDYGSENPVLQRLKVLSVDSENDHIIHLETAPVGLEENGVWALHTQTVQTQLFRALGIAEGEDGSYTITALQHEPQKEAIVDGGASFSSYSHTTHKTPNISHIEINSVEGETTIEADVSSVGIELFYDIKILKDGNLYDFRKGLKSPELNLSFLPNGDYLVVIYAKNSNGQLLKESSKSFVVDNPPRPSGVHLISGFKGVVISWDYVDEATQTEIFVSETDDIKTAKKVAKVQAQTYTHNINANVIRYYWLRHIRGINKGEFYKRAGLKAETALATDTELQKVREVFELDELRDSVEEVDKKVAKSNKNLTAKIADEATKRQQALIVQAREQEKKLVEEAKKLGTKITAVETATNDQSQQLSRLTVAKNNLVAGLEQERQARINGDKVEAQARANLVSQVEKNKAGLSTLSQTVATNQQSTVSQLTTLTAKVDSSVFGANLIPDSEFVNGFSELLIPNYNRSDIRTGINLSPMRTVEGMNIAFVERKGARSPTGKGRAIEIYRIPVEKGKTYQLSCYVQQATQNCNKTHIYYRPLVNGNWHSEKTSQKIIRIASAYNPNTTTLNTLTRHVINVHIAQDSEVDTIGLAIWIGEKTDDNVAYQFFTRPMICEVVDLNSPEVPYSIGSSKLQNESSNIKAELSQFKETQANRDRVLTTEINTAKSRLGNAESNIRALSQTVTNSQQTTASQLTTLTAKVDNVKVGGRNYILNSNVSLDNSNGIADYFHRLHFSSDLPLDAKVYTISADFNCENVSYPEQNSRVIVTAKVNFVDGTHSYLARFLATSKNNLSKLKGRFSTTLEYDKPISEINDVYIQIRNINGKAYIGNPKLEVGNVMSDWSPAPEDLDRKISTISANLSRFQETQATKNQSLTNEINTAKSRLGSAEGSIRTLSQTVATNQQSTASQITTLTARLNTKPKRYDWANGTSFYGKSISCEFPPSNAPVVYIKFRATDVEGGLHVKLNGVEKAIGFRGKNNEDKWYSIKVNSDINRNQPNVVVLENPEKTDGGSIYSVIWEEDNITDSQAESTHTIKTQAIAGGRIAVAGISVGAMANERTAESSIILMADKVGVVSSANDGTVKNLFSIVSGKVAVSGDLIADGMIMGKHIKANQTITAPNIQGGSVNVNNRFIVDNQGNLTANSGVFRGRIEGATITGGTIKGGTIKGGTIEGVTGTFSGNVYAKNLIDDVAKVYTWERHNQTITIPPFAKNRVLIIPGSNIKFWAHGASGSGSSFNIDAVLKSNRGDSIRDQDSIHTGGKTTLHLSGAIPIPRNTSLQVTLHIPTTYCNFKARVVGIAIC